MLRPQNLLFTNPALPPEAVKTLSSVTLCAGHIFGTAVEVLALEQDVWYSATLLHLSQPGWVVVSKAQPHSHAAFWIFPIHRVVELRQLAGTTKEVPMSQAIFCGFAFF